MSNRKLSNVAYHKAGELADKAIRVAKRLREKERQYVLADQFLRCSGSIGANLAEASSAISTADLSAKLSISLKEAREMMFWLDRLKNANYVSPKEYTDFHRSIDEICAMLFAALKTCKRTT